MKDPGAVDGGMSPEWWEVQNARDAAYEKRFRSSESPPRLIVSAAMRVEFTSAWQRWEEKMQTVKKQMRELKRIGKQMSQAPDGQISLTDPDARSMATTGRGTGIVGYDVQTAVDTKHHLIVAHEVTNTGHDSDHLSSMAHQARDAVGEELRRCSPTAASQGRGTSIVRKPAYDLHTQTQDFPPTEQSGSSTSSFSLRP